MHRCPTGFDRDAPCPPSCTPGQHTQILYVTPNAATYDLPGILHIAQAYHATFCRACKISGIAVSDAEPLRGGGVPYLVRYTVRQEGTTP